MRIDRVQLWVIGVITSFLSLVVASEASAENVAPQVRFSVIEHKCPKEEPRSKGCTDGVESILELTLNDLLPLDRAFELRGSVRKDVSLVTARMWRSWSDECAMDTGEPHIPLVVERVPPGAEGGQVTFGDFLEVKIAVDRITEPWWDYCFELTFWRRKPDSREFGPSSALRFLRQLRLAEASAQPTGLEILAAADAAELTIDCAAISGGDWDVQVACERDQSKQASRLAEESRLKVAYRRSIELSEEIGRLRENLRVAGLRAAKLPSDDALLLAVSMSQLPGRASKRSSVEEAAGLINWTIQSLAKLFEEHNVSFPEKLGLNPSGKEVEDTARDLRNSVLDFQMKVRDGISEEIKLRLESLSTEATQVEKERARLESQVSLSKRLREIRQHDIEIYAAVRKRLVDAALDKMDYAARRQAVESATLLVSKQAENNSDALRAFHTTANAGGPAGGAQPSSRTIDLLIELSDEIRSNIDQIRKEASRANRQDDGYANLQARLVATEADISEQIRLLDESIAENTQRLERLKNGQAAIELHQTAAKAAQDSLRAVMDHADEFGKAMRYAFTVVETQTLTRISANQPARVKKAATHVARAHGFFSTDVGAGLLSVDGEGRFAPITYVQLSMSFGMVDFDNGLGAITLPRGGTSGQRLWWHLLQRVSLSLGVTLTKPSLTLPTGREAGGLFGGAGPMGIVSGGFRATEFLKISAGWAIGTDGRSGGGYFDRLELFPMVGVSLDFPVYRVVGSALRPAPASAAGLVEERIDASIKKVSAEGKEVRP